MNFPLHGITISELFWNRHAVHLFIQRFEICFICDQTSNFDLRRISRKKTTYEETQRRNDEERATYKGIVCSFHKNTEDKKKIDISSSNLVNEVRQPILFPRALS